MLHYMVCPGLPTLEGCSSMGPYQPGTAMPFGVTGQSGQSKLRTAGGHRPGGPTIADPERPACSYNVQPDSEAREAEAELGLGRHLWPALMADIGVSESSSESDSPIRVVRLSSIRVARPRTRRCRPLGPNPGGAWRRDG